METCADSRKITHISQQQTKTSEELMEPVNKYLRSVKQKSVSIPSAHIYNLDETPCNFNMSHNRTRQGEKTIDGLDTGHSKNLFTVVLCVAADGRIIKTMVIFKSLKKVPRWLFGSMGTSLMKHWAKSCFANRNGPFTNNKSLLLMDLYGGHMKPEVIDFLQNKCHIETLFFPPKMTSCLV